MNKKYFYHYFLTRKTQKKQNINIVFLPFKFSVWSTMWTNKYLLFFVNIISQKYFFDREKFTNNKKISFLEKMRISFISSYVFLNFSGTWKINYCIKKNWFNYGIFRMIYRILFNHTLHKKNISDTFYFGLRFTLEHQCSLFLQNQAFYSIYTIYQRKTIQYKWNLMFKSEKKPSKFWLIRKFSQ